MKKPLSNARAASIKPNPYKPGRLSDSITTTMIHNNLPLTADY